MKSRYCQSILLALIVCLLPVLVGIYFLPTLSSAIAIHWGVSGHPDRWVSPEMVVFGIPIVMAILQLFVSVVTILRYPKSPLPKSAYAALWLIPLINMVIYFTTLYVALGHALNMGMVSAGIIAIILIVFGYCLPFTTMKQNKKRLFRNFPNEQAYHHAMKIISYTMIIAGIVIFLSIFFSQLIMMITLFGGIIVIIAVSLIVRYRNGV